MVAASSDGGLVNLGGRPKPDKSLTKRQAEIWIDVTNSLPSDWFRPEHHAMLAAYCKHVSTYEELSEQIERASAEDWVCDDEKLEVYRKLLAMRDKECARLVQLATKMRLTHQSSYEALSAATAKKNAGSGRRPWQDTDYEVK